jgi:hypothetical protein
MPNAGCVVQGLTVSSPFAQPPVDKLVIDYDPCDAKIARHRRRHRQRLRIFCCDACWGVGVHVTSKQVTYHAKLTWKFRKTNMLLWIIITKKHTVDKR